MKIPPNGAQSWSTRKGYNKMSSLQPLNNSDTVYVGCSSTDLLFGSELQSIVRYVFNHLDINANSNNPEENYRFYCDALGKKLGGGNPYDRQRTISTTSVEGVVRELKNLLPNNNLYIPQYQKMIQVVTETSRTAGNLSQVEHPGHLIFRLDDKEENDSYFSVIKIFRNGEDLEIIPCFLSIRSRKTVGGILFIRGSSELTSMCYKQRKYCLTKFDIQAIIEKIQEKAQLKWN